MSSSYPVIVDVISRDNKETITIDCCGSPHVWDVVQKLSCQIADLAPSNRDQQIIGVDNIMIRNQHGRALRPNSKINRGSRLIAEIIEINRKKESPGQDTLFSASDHYGECEHLEHKIGTPTEKLARKSDCVWQAEKNQPKHNSSIIREEKIPMSDSGRSGKLVRKVRKKRGSRRRPSGIPSQLHPRILSADEQTARCRECECIINEDWPSIELGLKPKQPSTNKRCKLSIRLRHKLCPLCMENGRWEEVDSALNTPQGTDCESEAFTRQDSVVSDERFDSQDVSCDKLLCRHSQDERNCSDQSVSTPEQLAMYSPETRSSGVIGDVQPPDSVILLTLDDADFQDTKTVPESIVSTLQRERSPTKCVNIALKKQSMMTSTPSTGQLSDQVAADRDTRWLQTDVEPKVHLPNETEESFVVDNSEDEFQEDHLDSNGEDVVVYIGRNELKHCDLGTLEEGGWLNDCRGYQEVKRWTKNVDLFAQDLIFIPIHEHSHWTLVVVNVKEHLLEYYNSSTWHDGYPNSMKYVKDYLRNEAFHRQKQHYMDVKWDMFSVEGIPVQQNSDDCGLFLCQYAKKLCLQQKVKFDPSNTVTLRHQILSELLNRHIEDD